MPKKLYRLLLVFSLLVALIVALLIFLNNQKPKNLAAEKKVGPLMLMVNFLDVGQGDAILIKTPKGKNVLIDGGPDANVIEDLSKSLPWYENTIDLVILSHPHDDHVGGLVSVFKKYNIKRAAYTGILHNSPAFLAWLKIVKEKHIPLSIIDKQQRITLDESCYLDIIHPFRSYFGKEMDNLNNSSIVAKLVYGKTSFLFMGDLEESAEKEMILHYSNESESFFTANVLKAGHHGSVTSSGEELLAKVKPSIVVIPVGKDNQFGHPSRRVLKRFEKQGTRIYRTDLDGELIISSDGEELIVEK